MCVYIYIYIYIYIFAFWKDRKQTKRGTLGLDVQREILITHIIYIYTPKPRQRWQCRRLKCNVCVKNRENLEKKTRHFAKGSLVPPLHYLELIMEELMAKKCTSTS